MFNFSVETLPSLVAQPRSHLHIRHSAQGGVPGMFILANSVAIRYDLFGPLLLNVWPS